MSARDNAIRSLEDARLEHNAARRQANRDKHAELILAAIVAEVDDTRLLDKQFRVYVKDLTHGLDLPTREKVDAVRMFPVPPRDLPPAA